MLMLGKLDKLGKVRPLGKLGGLKPLGRELSRAGMVGVLGRVPSISAWMMEGSGAVEEEEEEKCHTNEKMRRLK